jgi:RNA polymerase sigma-70 factor (ECF subfamily)
MQESASRYPGLPAGTIVTLDTSLEREFEDRLRDTSALAVRVAYSVLRQRQDAEDVAQEAFAKAHRRFAGLRDPDRFRAWMVRVTWRLAIDRWRANRRRAAREHAAEVATPVEDTEQLVANARRAARLWDSIDSLPAKLRIVIVLSAMEGHDLQHVAGLLKIPVGTVKSRLFLARKALAEKLQCLEKTPTR